MTSSSQPSSPDAPVPEAAGAKVIPMKTSDSNAAPGGPPKAAKRAKRVKKLDLGKLQILKRNFALQYCSQIAWDVQTRSAYPVAGLRNQFGNDEVRLWMASEERRSVHLEQIVFDPTNRCDPACINLFGGFEMVPLPGNCQPILDLLHHLVDADELLFNWILNWIAYALQHVGFKLPTAVIMHGDEGSGKNLFWEIVRDIYGSYGTVVGQDQLEDKFNDWLSHRLFVVGDEVLSRAEMRHLKGKLKSMISGTEIKINTKMLALRTETNHVNMAFLSNELQPNALDASDRRYCVIWTPVKKDLAFYQTVAACRDKGGKEAFYAMLLARDLAGFDPYAPPPLTRAKADLVDLGRATPERFYLEWSGGNLPVPFHSCSSAQAYRLYRKWCNAEGEKFVKAANVFGREVMRQSGTTIQIKPVRLVCTTKMWLVAPPPLNVEISTWSQDCIDAFEDKLKAYQHEI